MNISILNRGYTDYYNPITAIYEYDHKPVDCFWLEANLEEVYSKIFLDKYLPLEKQILRLIDNPIDHYNFYFWVARDLSRLWQLFYIFPYSGMNSCKKHYIYFSKFEIQSLEEIKYIDLEKLKIIS